MGGGVPRVVQIIFSRGHASQMDVITRYVFHGGGMPRVVQSIFSRGHASQMVSSLGMCFMGGGGGGAKSSPEHI